MPGGFYFPRTMDTRNRTSRSISPSPSNAAINDDSSGLRVGSRSRADSSPSIGNVSNMAHFGGQERGVESSLYPNLFPPTITGLDSVLPAQDIVSSNSGRIKHSEYDPGPTIPISVSTRRPSIPSVVTIPVRQTHAITYRTDTRNTNIHELRREDYTATSYVPVRSKVAADAVSQAMIKRRRKAALFKCCKCGADFTTKQNLNHHMNSHYNIKDHKCECGRGFGTRHVMRRHRNSCSIAKGNSPSGN
ncbi:hypothetical protein BDQ17DRAFT_664600 [Cyathus striatus]|nr:hypothetical protein BDQ17DRAFT_664600 [Cyathus striatus]